MSQGVSSSMRLLLQTSRPFSAQYRQIALCTNRYRIDADHADWGTLKMSEVAIQEWSNDKVVREKFVY